MKRSYIAALLVTVCMCLIAVSSVTATSTVKDATVSISVPTYQVLLSLSSASVLLLPLAICSAIGAVIALLHKQNNVGMFFAGISFFCFFLFMVLFAMEKKNDCLYTHISAALKEASIKFKKRDVKQINVSYTPLIYAGMVSLFTAVVLAKPSWKTSRDKVALRNDLRPYAYVLPHMFFFVLFIVTPALYGIYTAFTKWNLYGEPVFTGLDNFRTLFFDPENTYSQQLRRGLWNTIKFVIYCVPFCIALPLSLAVAMHTRCRGSKFFQAIYYLPSLMSISTVVLTWKYMFHYDYGVMNHLFNSTSNWFTPPFTWIMLVVVTVWWGTGGNMVIYQSALASIPIEHYEAASVDGASALQKFRYITLPGMRYPLMYTFVLSVVAQFNIYGQPLMLTGFTNNEANAVLLMYIQENAIKKQVAGMSASMVLILALVIAVVSFIQMRIMRKNAPI